MNKETLKEKVIGYSVGGTISAVGTIMAVVLGADTFIDMYSIGEYLSPEKWSALVLFGSVPFISYKFMKHTYNEYIQSLQNDEYPQKEEI